MLNLNFQAIQKLLAEIDELGLEIDGLWRVLQQTCDTRWLFGRLCVTPVRVNLTEEQQDVAEWLKDTYLPNFTNLSGQVKSDLQGLENIRKLKPVSFDLSTLGETVKNLWDQVTSWFSWPNLTNWILLMVGLLVGLVIVKSLLERLFQARQYRVTIMMAMSSTFDTPNSDHSDGHTPSWPPRAGHSGARFVAKRAAVSRV